MTDATQQTPSRGRGHVLLVEDNLGDVLLTKRAFRSTCLDIRVARDGEEALTLLFSGGYRPDIILLDLNLPRLSGREVIDQLKKSEITKRIPIVVLTTSDDETDILKSYDAFIASYVTKPSSPEEFERMAHRFEKWWFGENIFAPR